MARCRTSLISIIGLVLLSVTLSPPITAAMTHVWRSRTRAERETGILRGISLLEDGTLVLSPSLELIGQVEDPYVWNLTADRKGTIFVATGNEGRVYRQVVKAEFELIFEAPEPEVYALALDSQDRLYVGTSPQGKIYRVESTGDVTEFFSPGEVYIWSLVFDGDGNLYAGTGVEGRIYRITPTGVGEIVLDTDETHVRVLSRGPDGQILAGTDGNGLLIRIDKGGGSEVITQAPLKEITAITLGSDHEIYFSAVDRVTRRGVSIPSNQRGVPTPSGASTPRPETPILPKGDSESASPPRPRVQAGRAPRRAPSSQLESGIYRVESDGQAREIWGHRGELVLALSAEDKGTVIAGVNRDGKLYRIHADSGSTTLLSEISSAQITCLLSEPDGSTLVAGSNLGALYRLGHNPGREGLYESTTFDAEVFSSWGNISWEEKPGPSSIRLEVRSGNSPHPDATWSEWSLSHREASGSPIAAPPSRYVQWRATLERGKGKDSPQLGEVSVYYRQRNLPPQVTSIRVEGEPEADGGEAPGQGNGTGRSASRSRSNATSRALYPRREKAQRVAARDPGQRTVRWEASDPNDDDLVFSVYFRGIFETDWKPLEETIEESHLSWDASAMADGTYILKVVASDLPSNPPELSYEGERTSEPFDVDNNPPQIGAIRSQPGQGHARLEFSVRDSFSPVASVEYSINATGWKVSFPIDGFEDSLNEDYRLDLENLSPGEHTVAVRARDQAGNTAVAKARFVIE